ncbi:F-box/LRR-repeat protein-like protein [Salvia divinorum]|uniref:F-box/LRR-repeat protein-like protein n=1 Tax=Salvia divinorum TaxID=28513 RepID=A0ABD1G411_SALDI
MEEDRISQLSDEILLQILSFTDINTAVQTTILSTRWKNLCHSLSDLHFHLTRFAAHRHSPLDSRKAAEATSRRFSDFISHYLSRRAAAPIRTFLLSFDSRLVDTPAPFVDKCVLYALDHGVRSLHLRTNYYSHRLVWFASESLRELELTQLHHVAYLPPCFSIPHLKTLHLQGYGFVNNDDDDDDDEEEEDEDVDYHDVVAAAAAHDDDEAAAAAADSTTTEPFSGFPELEKLTLRRCVVSGVVLKAPSLRFLEIVDDAESWDFPLEMKMEEISAPSLTCFRYEGLSAFECSKVDLPNLEKVYFDVYNRFNVRGMDLKCVTMLHHFGNATSVALTLDTLKVIELDGCFIEQSPSPFPYMKRLKLIKGRWDISTVLQCVMDYLTAETLHRDSLTVEIPYGVDVVEHNLSIDGDDGGSDLLQLLQRLFE